ncbi:MAG: serine--tRNA ligase [Gammaproteobacteria bacterium]|nr:serine--tRNA ligase [Gammaproteobacteria bacterium]NNK97526.1 serine--tRNA ligase [Xanthomonadales bacterium]
MLDPQLLRHELATTAKALLERGYSLDTDAYEALEARRKTLQIKVEELQSQRNSSAKSIGQAKARGEDIQPLLEAVARLGDELKTAESEFREVRDQQAAWMLDMPNLAAADVPVGEDESENFELRKWGVVPTYDFKPRDHVELGELHKMMDAEAAAKLAGARFTLLKASFARLHRALAQFMLDVHTQEHGYTEVYVPYLVKGEAMQGTGQLPKFGDDAFATTDEPPRYLVPTAEVPVTNLAADTIYAADELPVKYVAQTPCFRREAGSAGQDTRGMIRQHQFEKVELVHIVRPEQSVAAHEELIRNAEKILEKLDLAYRTIVLCTGDMGFSACKTYDIEVWLPGQEAFREISSCSNCGDFQARRMKARVRNPETGKPESLHTLNGSGLAVGRTLIAVVENYQQRDGSIRVPDVLQPYMGGQEVITP